MELHKLIHNRLILPILILLDPSTHLSLKNMQKDFLWLYRNRMVVFDPSYVERSDVSVKQDGELHPILCGEWDHAWPWRNRMEDFTPFSEERSQWRRCVTSLTVNAIPVRNESVKLLTCTHDNFIQTAGIRDGLTSQRSSRFSIDLIPLILIMIPKWLSRLTYLMSLILVTVWRDLTLDVLSGHPSVDYVCDLKWGDTIPPVISCLIYLVTFTPDTLTKSTNDTLTGTDRFTSHRGRLGDRRGSLPEVNVSKISVLRSPDVTQQAVFDTTQHHQPQSHPPPPQWGCSSHFFLSWRFRWYRCASFFVFSCTDTHLYVFPLPFLTLALSVVHHKIIPREWEHEIPWQFPTTVGWGNTKSSSVDHMMILGSTGFLFWYKKTSRTKKKLLLNGTWKNVHHVYHSKQEK